MSGPGHPRHDRRAGDRLRLRRSGSRRTPVRRAPRRSRCCPGGSTRSGWSRWPSSSTPSTSRGPGREKVDAASTANTRRAPSGLDPVPVLERLGARVRRRTSRRASRSTTSGLRPGELAPGDLGRLQPRRPGDVLAAGDRDHLGDPVAADEGRVEPLERDHPRRARSRDGGADRRQPSLQLAAQLVRLVRDLRSPRRAGPRPRASRRACSGPAGRTRGLPGRRAATSSTSS